MDERTPTDRVLIVDADALHVAALEDELRTVNCRVSVCSGLQAAVATLRAEHVDLVVMVPPFPARWKEDADSLCDAVRQLEDRPQILCILRGPYRGPGNRLYGDRLNVRVLHEE